MIEHDAQRAVEATNLQARNCMRSAAQMLSALQEEHPPLTALTITFDAFVTAAVGVLQSAKAQGFINDIDAPARRRLEYILSLPAYIHERQPDGSFGPGHPVN